VITAIEEMLDGVRKVANEQSNRIAGELNAAYDQQNAAMARFNQQMKLAKAKREEAERIEADAVRDLDTAFGNTGAVSLSIIQQIGEGRIVTGSDTPAPARRPKLVKAAAEG
jgi:hypothetical protein